MVAPPARRAAVVRAGALLALMCLLYVVAVGWPAGRELDAASRPDEDDGTFWRALLAVAVYSLHEVTFVLAGAVAIVLAFRRGGTRLAIAVGGVLTGPVVSAWLLELVFRDGLDPFGAEHKRPLGVGFFPSGHTTAAMSLAVAAVMVAPDDRRRIVGALAAAYAAVVGIGLVATDSHTTSDILGGYLLTGAWGIAMTAVARKPGGDGLRQGAAVVAGAAAALALLGATAVDPPASGGAAFALASGGLTVVAFALIALLQRG